MKEWGQRILAAPPRHGFNLLAWALPLVGIVAGAGIMGLLAWRWTRVREPEPSPQQFALNGHPLGPEEERRLDEELARASMGGTSPRARDRRDSRSRRLWLSGSRGFRRGPGLDRVPLCAAARAGLPLGDLRSRGRPARGARGGEEDRVGEHAFRNRVHGGLRAARRRGGGARPLGRPGEPRQDRRLRARGSRPRLRGTAAVAGADAGARRDRPRAGKRLTRAARRGVRRLRRAVRRDRARRRSSCLPRTPEPWCAAACCSPRTRWA